MTSNIAVAERLYAAFAVQNPRAILAQLADDFRGHVSAGMPLGVGGTHEGPTAMLEDVWIPVFLGYDVAPVPDEILEMPAGRAMVHGTYIGTERSTGREVKAEFVHLLTFDDGRISSLRQVVDTAAWRGTQEDPAT